MSSTSYAKYSGLASSSSGSGVVTIYATTAAFPVSTTTGDLAVDASTGNLYEFNGASWVQIAGPGAAISLGNLDSLATSATKGANLVGGALAMQSASATVPGVVNITSQTFTGNKTIVGEILSSGISGIVAVGQYPFVPSSSVSSIAMVADAADPRLKFWNGQSSEYDIVFGPSSGLSVNKPSSGGRLIDIADTSLTAANSDTGVPYLTVNASNATFLGAIGASNFSGTSSGTNTGDVTLAAVGSSPSANAASLSSQVLTLQPADGTHPGVVTSGTQTIGGAKTFSTSLATPSLSMTGNIAMGNNSITGLATPVSSTDAVTKAYVDSLNNGISWKTVCRVATTANISLTGTQTIDGVAVIVGDRVLVANQSTASQNGIYVVASGAWARSSDATTGTQLVGAAVFVDEGTANADKGYFQTAIAPITVGSTSIVFVQNFGTGTYLADGTSLTLTSNTFSVANLGVTNAKIANSTIDLTTKVTGALPIANGGTGQTTKSPAFDALQPMTTLGDIIYGGASGTGTRLAGDTSNTKKFLTSTSSAGVAAAPAWNTIAAGDLPTITLTGDVTGAASGGSIATSLAATSNATLVTLSALTTASSLVSVGTITSGTWSATTIAVNKGGTGVTSVTTAPAATAFAGWDANKNLSSNNLIEGYSTTATGAGTTTLVVGSTFQQYFTGSSTQTCVLPVATTLINGQSFQITNTSSGVVTVQSSGLNTIQAMAANSQLVVTCINTSGGTGTASWQWTYGLIAAGLPLTNPMTTGGDIIYGGASGTPTRLANGTSGQYLQSAGGTSAPTWVTINAGTAPTVQTFTSTGSTAGYIFTVTSANATVGATYTNNSNTYTVVSTIAASTTLYCSGASAPTASGTLTKSAGTGDSTITFSAALAYATYTLPTNPSPLYIRVRMVGAGGAGGSVATAATTSAAAGGGGGGGYCEKIITSPSATYPYAVGVAGAHSSAGNNAGGNGGSTVFATGTLIAGGGTGGGGCPAVNATNVGGTGSGGGVSSGGTINSQGSPGQYGLTFGTSGAQSGAGGSSALGGGGTARFTSTNTGGDSGKAYGGGGGGAAQSNNGSSNTGGDGASGVIFVEEYYQ